MTWTATHWIESAPAHWTRGRIKNLLTSATNGVWGSEPVGGETEVSCIRAADFDRTRRRVKEDALPLRSIDPSALRQHRLNPGDLILEKSGGGEKQPVGMAVLYERSGAAVCSNFCARIVPASNIDSRFLTYVFSAAYGQGLTQSAIKQTTGIQNLDVGAFFASAWAYPEVEEQRRIADFLDVETARIDALASLKRIQGERLQERFDSRLVHALLPAITPDSWRETRLKFLFGFSRNGVWGDEPLGNGTDLRCVRVADFDRETLRNYPDVPTFRQVAPDVLKGRILEAGDVLLEKSGGGEKSPVGFAVTYDSEHRSVCSNFIVILRAADDMNPRYVGLLLAAQYKAGSNIPFIKQTTGIQNLDVEGYLSQTVAVPPKGQQDALARELDQILAITQKTRRLLRQQLALLAERRQTLITAAITGRFDVSTAGGREVLEGVPSSTVWDPTKTDQVQFG